jgi:hypothetical protein
MKRSSLVLVRAVILGAAVAAVGCGKIDDNEFAASVPTRDTVALVVPAPSASGAMATSASAGVTVKTGALQGQVAKDYQLTAAVVTVVNGATGAILDLIKGVTLYPPTSVSGDTAVWGPFTDPLSANTYRLTVTHTAPHVFDWKLDGRAKTASDDTFVTVLSGEHTRALDAAGQPLEGFGSGTFTLDWDNADMLPQHDSNVGQVAFTYSRTSPTATVTDDVTFTNVLDSCDPTTCSTHGQIFDAIYDYTSTPGSGGDLQYGANENFVATTAALETLSLHSRWQEDGAGRTDIQLTGGDVSAATQTASECWDSNFLSQYSVTTYDQTLDWGSESSCAFPTAAFVSLSPGP